MQQRFRLATDAARNAAGQIVCRSQLPGVVTPTPPNAADAAVLAAEIAACVPLNLFGEGAPSAAAIAYVNADTRSIQRHEQKVVSGYVGGDLSQLFELPAGPVAFALGGEWREEDGFRDYGDIVALGRTFLTAISSFRPAEKFAVKEVFGEIGVPLLKDKPFFQELSLQGAARYAEYRGRVGSVLSWDAGASWSPIEDVRFRANLATSVRAPTQLDLFATLGQNFNQLSDPCDVNFINNGTATRPANCLAAGIPVGFINLPARASSTAFSAGGNKLLNAEKARSWTIGGVFQPRFAPGLVVSIDYYDITIADQISAPTAQQILDNCYNGASLNNVFCDVIRRDPATKLFSTVGPEFGLVQGGINFASAKARGVDFDVSYRHDVGIGKLSTQLRGTYVLRRDDFPFVSEPNRPDQRLLEVGDPRLQMNLSTTLQRNAWSIGYDVRYISKQAVASVGSGGGIEDIQTIGGRPPQNADFSEAEFISAVVYYNLRLGYDFSDKLNLYGGVENALNKLPPIGLIGNGGVYAADAIFDNVGRYFYAGAKVKF